VRCAVCCVLWPALAALAPGRWPLGALVGLGLGAPLGTRTAARARARRGRMGVLRQQRHMAMRACARAGERGVRCQMAAGWSTPCP
jgi:hypothetical protein